MKTAISVPDAIFAHVEQRVKELGMSRSEFFSRAAERYLEELDRESITEQLNAAIEAEGPEVAAEEAEWVEFGLAQLARLTEGDEW